MASYLSYLTSGTSNNPSQSHGGQGAASTWSSHFASRMATLRKALTKDSEDDDPDNEDCSHVSNVLRGYYTEKGRTFPEWLPADPKKPAPIPPQIQYAQYGQYGNAYGAQQGHERGGSGGPGGAGGRGGLSDLWDPSPSAPVAAPAPQSLRAPRPTPQSLRSYDSGSSQSGGRGAMASVYSQPASGARPLPSQRAGSFQNSQAANSPAMGSRDRLRARLQGGGSGRNSPAPASGQVSYSSNAGSYDSSTGAGSPYVSASEPWSNTANPYQYDTTPPAPNPYGNPGYRQRPGGPR